MRRLTIYFILMLFIAGILTNPAIILAGDVEPGDTVTIMTPGVTARLCSEPMCGPDQHIMRIAEGTELEVEDTEDVKIGSIHVTWFQVVVDGNAGWISIYDTNRAP